MSDLFVSEILILVFLILAMLRPFSKGLKKVPGTLWLPLFSIILCVFTIAGQGIYFSLVLILLLSILTFLFTLPKLFSSMTELSSNIYSIVELVFSLLFLTFGIALAIAVYFFTPVATIKIPEKISSEKIILGSFDKQQLGEIYILENAKQLKNDAIKTSIIFLPTTKKTSYETNAIMHKLLSTGYKLICFESLEKPHKLIPKNFYNFLACHKILFEKMFGQKNTENKNEVLQATGNRFNKTIQNTISKYCKDEFVFIFSEGIYNKVLLKNFQEKPIENVCGIFLVTDKNTMVENAFITNPDAEINYTDEVKNANVFLYQIPDEHFPGLGEIRGDDVLATTLMGGKIDTDRKSRQKIADVFAKWIYVKR